MTCPILVYAFVASAQTTQFIDRWITAQTNVQTWSADLIQTRTIKTLSEPLVSMGKTWVAVPDRFRWELGQPAQTVVIRKQEQLFILYPRLKRAEKYPLKGLESGPWKDALALLEATFPRSRADLEAQFELVSVAQTNSVACLALQPRSSMAKKFISGLQISFRTNDFSPVSTTLSFRDGSSMRNEFTNVTINPPLNESLFDLTLPAGFSLVEPLKR